MAEHKADVAIIMGSQSDWATMRHAAELLEVLEIPHKALIVSAHRTRTGYTSSPTAPRRQATK